MVNKIENKFIKREFSILLKTTLRGNFILTIFKKYLKFCKKEGL